MAFRLLASTSLHLLLSSHSRRSFLRWAGEGLPVGDGPFDRTPWIFLSGQREPVPILPISNTASNDHSLMVLRQPLLHADPPRGQSLDDGGRFRCPHSKFRRATCPAHQFPFLQSLLHFVGQRGWCGLIQILIERYGKRAIVALSASEYRLAALSSHFPSLSSVRGLI